MIYRVIVNVYFEQYSSSILNSIIIIIIYDRDNVAKNKTRFLYVLYYDKTWVLDQSERAQGAIYIIIIIH